MGGPSRMSTATGLGQSTRASPWQQAGHAHNTVPCRVRGYVGTCGVTPVSGTTSLHPASTKGRLTLQSRAAMRQPGGRRVCPQLSLLSGQRLCRDVRRDPCSCDDQSPPGTTLKACDESKLLCTSYLRPAHHVGSSTPRQASSTADFQAVVHSPWPNSLTRPAYQLEPTRSQSGTSTGPRPPGGSTKASYPRRGPTPGFRACTAAAGRLRSEWTAPHRPRRPTCNKMQFPTFHALLAALLDNDNVRRGAAEAEYTRLKCDADTLLSNLVQVRYGGALCAWSAQCGAIPRSATEWRARIPVHRP